MFVICLPVTLPLFQIHICRFFAIFIVFFLFFAALNFCYNLATKSLKVVLLSNAQQAFHSVVVTYKMSTCIKVEPDVDVQKIAHSTVAKKLKNQTIVKS